MFALIRHNLNIGSRLLRGSRVVLVAATLLGGVAAQALQAGTTASQLNEQPISPATTSAYLATNANIQGTGWQVGGLNSQFSSNLGKSLLNFSGGMYFSQNITSQPAPLSTPAPASLAQMNPAAGSGSNTPASSLANLFAGGNAALGGKSDQVIVQRVTYQGNGFNLQGNYASAGSQFQGMSDLTKQMNSADAALVSQGKTQTSYQLCYSGIKGCQLTSSRSMVATDLAGDSNNGLTRAIQTNGLAFAFGRQHLALSLSTQTDAWNPNVVQHDGATTKTQALTLTRDLGLHSQLSLGQTLVDTQSSSQQPAQCTQQRNLALQWNDWKNVKFSGGYTDQADEQSGGRNQVLNMSLDTNVSPQCQFSGKLADNSQFDPQTAHTALNNALNLKCTSALTHHLQFVSAYSATDVDAQGRTSNNDQQLTWSPNSRWKLVTHVAATDCDQTGTTSLAEMTLSRQLGSKVHPAQLTLVSHEDVQPNGGRNAMYQCGLSQQIGKAAVQVTQTYSNTATATTPAPTPAAADSNPTALTDLTTLCKFTLTCGKALPAWATNSLHASVFSDSATWVAYKQPDWVTPPTTAGLTLEKRMGQNETGKQYAAQLAGMLSRNLYGQARSEMNPLLPNDPTHYDTVARNLLHLGYTLKPNIQLYGRYTDEQRFDIPSLLNTYSLGIAGQLSSVERLQCQFDVMISAINAQCLTGNAYQVEYERIVSTSNAVSLKLRAAPTAFANTAGALRMETSVRHTF